MFFTGDNLRSKFKFFFHNLGWNLLTFLTIMAMIPLTVLTIMMSRKIYGMTCKSGSCLRFWMKKANRKFLRKGRKLKKKASAHKNDDLEDENSDNQEGLELVPQQSQRGELVPYRQRGRAPNAPRRSQFPEINDFS